MTEWPEDAHRDRLVGDWALWQRKGGHRTSTDDVLAAWLAVRTRPAPARYIDIGCGIGSVMLMVAHATRPGTTFGIEAQAQSAAMALRTVAELPSPPSIAIRHADLRDLDVADLGGRFDLVTGSPPYFPEGTGIPSPDPQRTACRFELRGGVEAYCDAAARLMAANGAFVVVHQTACAGRVLSAAERSGLHLRTRVDVRTRADRPAPFLSVFHFEHSAGATEVLTFATRAADNTVTAEYERARSLLGLVTR